MLGVTLVEISGDGEKEGEISDNNEFVIAGVDMIGVGVGVGEETEGRVRLGFLFHLWIPYMIAQRQARATLTMIQ